MEMKNQMILQVEPFEHFKLKEQSRNQEETLKGISHFIKDLKNMQNSPILGNISWIQIKKQTNFLLSYLSRQKITDKALFFDTLASFDSLLSIFKVKLFAQLKFTKTFYHNIRRQFEFLCLQYGQPVQENQQKILQIQLYTVLFLLVMLIYFSGKQELCQNKDLPLKIISKSLINNFVSLDINITPKNERVVGLIVGYLIKNINIKIYGQKMLKFILNHLDKTLTPRGLYHFVFCLREIHIQRQMDIKTIKKYGLIQKLIKFWVQAFYNPQSIYLIDCISVILQKYQSLWFLLNVQPLVLRLGDFQKINQFSTVHQGLILQIKAKLIPNIETSYKARIFKKAFSTCQVLNYSLKFLSCFTSYQTFHQTIQYISQFINSLTHICKQRQMNRILLSVQVFNHLVQMCLKNGAYSLLSMLKYMSQSTILELKDLQICGRDFSTLEVNLSKMISIQQLTLN